MKFWIAIQLCTSMTLLASVNVNAARPGGSSPSQFQNLATGSLADTGAGSFNEVLNALAAPAQDSGIQIAAAPAGGETPEPATFLLLGGALVGLGVIRRRKRRTAGK